MASQRPPATTLHHRYQPPATALLVYPATLLLGSLFSVLSPTAQHQHELPPHHADPPGPAVNYFARKDNIFNAYFVKIGWFWTTVAFAALVSSSSPPSSPAPTDRNRKLAQSLLRYLLATFSWFLTTQWFFGPGLLDRGFVLTGGRCERAARHVHGEAEGGGRVVLEDLFSGHACKAAGGRWSGGHD
ncbi:inositol phospholipid biosynthesis protein, partial [Aspergillus sp. HF37]